MTTGIVRTPQGGVDGRLAGMSVPDTVLFRIVSRW